MQRLATARRARPRQTRGIESGRRRGLSAIRLVAPLACALATAACPAASSSSGAFPRLDGVSGFPGGLGGAPAELFRAASGLDVLVVPDPSVDLVTVDARIAVGSSADPDGLAGLAHLVEHARFALRLDPPGGAAASVADELASVALYHNAYTTWDATHYTAIAPADRLARLLDIEVRRLRAGCDALSEQAFARERAIVQNELSQRQSTQKQALTALLLAEIYPAGHPYRRAVGGDTAQVARATRADACRFMAAHYTPERTTIVVTGAATMDAVKRALAPHLEARPQRSAAPAGPGADRYRPRASPVPAVATTPGVRAVTRWLDVDDPLALVAIPLPPRHAPEAHAAEFALALLADELAAAGEPGPNGRNSDSSAPVIRGAGIARLGGARAPVAIAWVRADADQLDAAARLVIDRAAGAVRGDPAALALALETYQQRATSDVLTRIERLRERGRVFADLLHDDALAPPGRDSPALIAGEFARIESTSLATVRATTEWMLARVRLVRVAPDPSRPLAARAAHIALATGFDAAPHAPDAPAHEPDGPDGIGLLDAAPTLDVRISDRWASRGRADTLGNGLRVLMFPTDSAPVVELRLVMPVGTHDDPPGRAGTARAAAELWKLELSGLAAQQFETAIAFHRAGGRVVTRAGARATTVQVRGAAPYLDVFLRGLGQLCRHGGFAHADVERWRRRALAAHDDADRARLDRHKLAFRRALFGPSVSAGAGESTASLLAIHGDTLRKFRDRHFVPAGATLIVSGRFDPADAIARVRSAFGDWSGPAAPGSQPASTTTTARDPRPVFLAVPDPSARQVRVTVAFPTPAGGDADDPARRVLIQLLARRAAVVRQILGASYGMSVYRTEASAGGVAGAPAGAVVGAVVIEGLVDPARAGAALRAVLFGIDALRRPSRDPAQAAREQAALSRAFALSRREVVAELLLAASDSSGIADQLAFIAEHALPADYFDRLVREVAALSLADVQRVIARELAPGRETVMCTGPRAAVEAAFREVGIRGYQLLE